MKTFTAIRFDGSRSSGTPAEVSILDDSQIEVLCEGQAEIISLSECRMDPPLANVRRIFALPDGSHLETENLDIFDTLYRKRHQKIGMRLVFWLESKWHLVGFCVFGLIVSLISAFIWGIPAVARVVAKTSPVEWNEALGKGTMEALDEYFMEPSELSEEDKEKYTSWFNELKADFPSDHDLKINFRSSFMGPNALALPNGMIVVTDPLIELMEDREEFEAVMVHEIAHVIERHSLQMVLRDAGVFIFVSVILGDASSITSLSASIPYMLVENGYSRKIESEADLVSGQWLQSKYGSTESLKSILTKLYESSEGPELPEMISTHPDLHNRIMLLEETFSLQEDSEKQ